jgi:hypothetical protein
MILQPSSKFHWGLIGWNHSEDGRVATVDGVEYVGVAWEVMTVGAECEGVGVGFPRGGEDMHPEKQSTKIRSTKESQNDQLAIPTDRCIGCHEIKNMPLCPKVPFLHSIRVSIKVINEEANTKISQKLSPFLI